MRRFALLLGFALPLFAGSASSQPCDGFTDVLASSPFCPDVTRIAAYGITNGCAPSQFCLTENVSRLQIAAFMHRLGEHAEFVDGGNAFGSAAALGTNDNYSVAFVTDGHQAILLQPAVDSESGFNTTDKP